MLEDLFPGFLSRISQTCAHLREDEDYLSSLAAQAVESARWEGEDLILPAAALADQPQSVAIRGARMLIGSMTAGNDNCAAPHLEGLLNLCRGSDPSARLDLPGGLTARRRYGELVLSRSAPTPLSPRDLNLAGETRAGDWTVRCLPGTYQGERQSPLDCWLAQEAAPMPTLRPRRTGDVLAPPGRHEKSVKKWMIDQKIPACLPGRRPCGGRGRHRRRCGPAGPPPGLRAPEGTAQLAHHLCSPGLSGPLRRQIPPLPQGNMLLYRIVRKEENYVQEKDIQEVLFSQQQLEERVDQIAQEICPRLSAGKEIVLISVLRGSFVFMADLCRRIDLPCTIDFMSVSSYGSGTSSTGQVQITKDLSGDISGKHILVVEDILDSGDTLSYLLKLLEQRKPASIRLCTLLDKPERRIKPVEVHYSGFTIPDAFVVGYGLDYAEHYRNLPYIGILKPEVYRGLSPFEIRSGGIQPHGVCRLADRQPHPPERK